MTMVVPPQPPVIGGWPAPPAALQILAGPGAGRVLDVPPGGALLGRGPECGVVLDDPTVSRRHAAIRWDGRRYLLTDIGSSNRTLLNGRWLAHAAPLASGDRITVGETTLQLQVAASSGRVPSAVMSARPPGFSTRGTVELSRARRAQRNRSSRPLVAVLLAVLGLLALGAAAFAARSAAPLSPTATLRPTVPLGQSPTVLLIATQDPLLVPTAGAPASGTPASTPGTEVSPAPLPTLTTPAMFARVRPATVLVHRRGAIGTGVVVDRRGLILTAAHVVGGSNAAEVILQGNESLPAVVLDAAPELDLVVLRVERTDLPAADLGDSDAVHPGDAVVALGYPDVLLDTALGEIARPSLEPNVTSGIVVNLRDGTRPPAPLIQVDAQIGHGYSGGPLLNTAAQVIGISELVVPAPSGDALLDPPARFATAINAAKPLIDQARAAL